MGCEKQTGTLLLRAMANIHERSSKQRLKLWLAKILSEAKRPIFSSMVFSVGILGRRYYLLITDHREGDPLSMPCCSRICAGQSIQDVDRSTDFNDRG